MFSFINRFFTAPAAAPVAAAPAVDPVAAAPAAVAPVAPAPVAPVAAGNNTQMTAPAAPVAPAPVSEDRNNLAIIERKQAAADSAAETLSAAVKVVVSAKDYSAAAVAPVVAAAAAADNLRINSAKGLKELQYMPIFAALNMINSAVKSYSAAAVDDYTGEVINVNSAAPAAELAKLLSIMGFKKFTIKDLLFFEFGEEIVYCNNSRDMLINSSYFTKTAKLAYISGKLIQAAYKDSDNTKHAAVYEYNAVELGKNGLYRIEDIAKSIFCRYDSYIKSYNKKLNNAISAANKVAVNNKCSAIFTGSSAQYVTAVINKERREYCAAVEKLLSEDSAAAPVAPVAPVSDNSAAAPAPVAPVVPIATAPAAPAPVAPVAVSLLAPAAAPVAPAVNQ